MMSATIALRLATGVALMMMIALLMYFCVNVVILIAFGLVGKLYVSHGLSILYLVVNARVILRMCQFLRMYM